MRFAVIGDVHSNIFALQSVLEDIKMKKVDFVVSTGDLVGYLPFPNEVIEAVQENRILVVQGNHDKLIANSNSIKDEIIESMKDEEIQRNASEIFTNWVITDENRNFLSNLPGQLRINCNEITILIVHGSPRDIGEYLYEDKHNLTELSKELSEDVVICGHTHIPYHYRINNKHFINAGSVGKPKHGSPQAAYVIVTVEGKNVMSETAYVNYDTDSMIKTIKKNRMISDKLIPMLEQGF
ncbi:MAG: phosphodiesterase, family [Clostridia bacterium]|jgi:putative phosphoesterase|nr:phosphodiesterase, family [Clostridia bacterium]